MQPFGGWNGGAQSSWNGGDQGGCSGGGWNGGEKGGKGHINPASGEMDWLCRMCRERNFSRRMDCFKCHVPRPPDAELVQAPMLTAPPNGSTLTGMVKSYNKKGFGFIMVFGHNSPDIFYTRENVSQRLMHPDMPGEQVTFELFRERGKLVARNIRPLGDDNSKGACKGMINARADFHQSRLDEGQWKCPFCQEQNFARRTECFRCRAPKSQGPPASGGFSDGPGNVRPPPAPRKTFSPHAGARAIRESLRAEMAAKSGASAGGKSGKSSSSSSSSSAKKKSSKKRKRSSSSSSSSKKKHSKKKKSKKKRSSSSKSSSSSGVVVEADGAAGDAKSSSGNAEIDKAKADALKELQRLQSVEPKDVRMSEFRALLRCWHPDKNPDRVELATAVFQFVQKGKVLVNQ